MNDAELNLKLAKLVYPDENIVFKGGGGGGGIYTEAEMPYFKGIPDYCNNWNDLMPLVVEYKINLNYDFVYSRWEAETLRRDGYEFTSTNKNPQRALAECLLKVLMEKTL